MEIKKSWYWVITFTLIYLLAFTIYYLSIKNYEFLLYIAVLVFFFFLILFTMNKTKFDLVVLWGLSIWGFLHMCGGGVIIHGDVLYNFIIIRLWEIGGDTILRFDKVVHAFGFGIATLVTYQLLKPHLKNKVSWKVIYFLLILMGMGLGALNEIIEFIAVVSVPDTNVGGYANSSLDLIFNGIGAIIAVIFIHLQRNYSKRVN